MGGRGHSDGGAGIIARTPSVLLNNDQSEEINCLDKYQTCSVCKLNSKGWGGAVTMVISQDR